jgi:hypothetical protein
MKKIYIKPGCEVVEIKTQCHLMQPSNVDTKGLNEKLDYDPSGGDPENSW